MKPLFLKYKKRSRSQILGLIITSSLLAVLSPPSGAAESAGKNSSPWIKTDQTSVRLISANSSIGNSQNIQLGLQFKIRNGWKIYWRSPGDAGYPPSINWKKSENLKKTDFSWPLPNRFTVSGIQTIGYKKEVVFPINAKVRDVTQGLKLRGALSYLVCDEICIPYKTNLALNIPPGATAEFLSENHHLINQYVGKVPGTGKAHNISIESVETTKHFTEVEKNIRKGFILIKVISGIPFTKPDVFIEGPDLIFYGTPKVRLNNKRSIATIKVPVTEEEDAKIVMAKLRLTIKDGERSAEQTLTVTPGISLPTLSINQGLSLPLIIAFALLGGFILNLMPCVLPVMSLKILSVMSQGGANNKSVRTSFIASSLGIIFSFLVIGIGLISLKLAGSTVGWGIQFQHPWFIVSLTIIVTLFAYNLWGMFEFSLPSWINDRASSSTGKTEYRQSFSSNFATGAFATILATPCSAPFLGTAVSFALAGDSSDILAVFSALGVGMALPFLTIAIFPSIASQMPKPGLWMVSVKKVLGAALAATAVWLLSVLALQLSKTAALVVAFLMVLIGLTLIARNRSPENKKRLASICIITIILGAFWTPYKFTPSLIEINNSKQPYWQAFTPGIIPELIAQGKTIFVDITAEWCITCQINKATVLRSGQIQSLLKSGEVIAMQGDWTRPDAKITAYLESFNRFGIPFNAIYGPGAPQGLALPELLTKNIVLGGLKAASNGSLFTAK